jgi:hypothetical protein
MKPKRHPSNNRIVGAPANWDDRGGKLELPAIDVTQGKISGIDVFVSFWKPTEEELGCLLRGGQVQLTCIGGQPAVNLSVADESGHPNIVLPN